MKLPSYLTEANLSKRFNRTVAVKCGSFLMVRLKWASEHMAFMQRRINVHATSFDV